MKKLIICLATLLAGTTCAWAEYDGYVGTMSTGLLKYELPEEGGTLRIYSELGDQYEPMSDFIPNYSGWDPRVWARDPEIAPKIHGIDMQQGINIGNYAFYELPNLTNVNLHKTTSTVWAIYCIGNYAFANSTKLTDINSEVLTDLR